MIISLFIHQQKHNMENQYCNCEYPKINSICQSCDRLISDCHCDFDDIDHNHFICINCKKERIPDLIESDEDDNYYSQIIIPVFTIRKNVISKKRQINEKIKVVIRKRFRI